MEEIGAMKLLAVCLGHGDNVLPSIEDLNLENSNSFNHVLETLMVNTSSATSGPLLVKLLSLLTETFVLIVPSSV